MKPHEQADLGACIHLLLSPPLRLFALRLLGLLLDDSLHSRGGQVSVTIAHQGHSSQPRPAAEGQSSNCLPAVHLRLPSWSDASAAILKLAATQHSQQQVCLHLALRPLSGQGHLIASIAALHLLHSSWPACPWA